MHVIIEVTNNLLKICNAFVSKAVPGFEMLKNK